MILRGWAALAAACLLGACASLTQAPGISLAGLTVESIGVFEQRYVLRLRVRNPNEVSLPINGLNFELELGGQPFASGVSNKPVTIPRLAEGILEVRASSDLASFLKRFGEIKKSQETIDYRVKGQLQVAGFGAVPFDNQGKMPFNRLPALERKAPSAKPLPGAI